MSDGTFFFAAEQSPDGTMQFTINPDALTTAEDAGIAVYYLQKQLAMALEHFDKSGSYGEALMDIVRGSSEEMQRDTERMQEAGGGSA